MFGHLTGLLHMATSAQAPEALRARRAAVSSAYDGFIAALSRGETASVYGVDVRVGHRAREGGVGVFDHDAQMALLRSHAIGGAPTFGSFAARCVAAAKAYAASTAATLHSGALYDLILDAAADETFHPEIPAHASYSCGDVIPAAHFALALLGRPAASGYALQPGEALALMNGCFVQLGAAAALAPRALRILPLFIELARQATRLTRQPAEVGRAAAAAHPAAEAALSYIFEDQKPADGAFVQPPVSLRGLGPVIDAALGATEGFLRALDTQIRLPSGNPLLTRDGETAEALPSGSFLAPNLTLAASTLIEAQLLLGWAIVAHAHYLHRGVAGLPVDLASEAQPFGAAQRPKLMQATLERTRRMVGARAFISGGATSYGEEDLWSFGLDTIEALGRTIACCEDLLTEQAIALRQAGLLAKAQPPALATLLGAAAEPPPDAAAMRARLLAWDAADAAAAIRPQAPWIDLATSGG